jgi:cation transport protein ChaC
MAGQRLWVFAYASLLWLPGFTPEKTLTAWIHGYHRSLCLLSVRYRGTEKNPGLVMGLDKGGSCRGQVHLVKAGEEERVTADLFEREMKTGVYHPLFLNARLEDGKDVKALSFVARRDHEQYRRLSEADAARLVRTGVGEKGRAYDYLECTLKRMDELGIHDARLWRILKSAG